MLIFDKFLVLDRNKMVLNGLESSLRGPWFPSSRQRSISLTVVLT